MRFFRTLRWPGILVLAAASLGLNLVGSLAAADRANVTSVTGISGSPGFRAMAKAFATGDAKTGAGARLGSDLLALKAEYEDHLINTPNSQFHATNPNAPIDNSEAVAVDIAAEGDPEALAEKLRALGLRNAAVAGRLISGWLPLSALTIVGQNPDIRFLRPAYSVHNSGTVQTQGDVAQRSDLVRAFGLDGTGVKVGVISDSYNLGNGAANNTLSGDLPGVGNPNGHTTPVQVLADSGAGLDEGRAMLQIVHDVAPGSPLAFATGNGGVAVMANAILNLGITNNCKVVVDDLLYFGESMFQDGQIARAVDSVVANGSSYFSSAGNSAALSYTAPFRNSGSNLLAYLTDQGFGEDFIAHDFDPGPGVDIFQAISIPTGVTRLVLQWDEPFFSNSGAPGSRSDLDFMVLDGTDLSTANIITLASSANFGLDPVEVLGFNNSGAPTTIQLVIGNTKAGFPAAFGPEPGHLKIVVFSDGAFAFSEYNTASSTCFGHANAAGAIGVGATRFNQTPALGVTPPLLEFFSARGGTPILFNNAGGTLGAPEIRLSPALTAPDGGATTNVGPNFTSFFGTSASAPHAGAVAALLQQNAGGTLTPAQIRFALTNTAIDILPAGYDFDSGAGLLDARAALGVAFSAPITNPDLVQREPNRNLKIPISLLLDNDADPNGDPVTLVSVNTPSAQSATVRVDGQFITYLAPAGNSTDSFSYTVTDGHGHNSNGTVTVNVGALDDLLGRPNITSIVTSGGNVVLSFVGVPGRSYQVQFTTSASLPAPWTNFPGLVTASANGRFSFTDVAPPPPVRLYRAVEATSPP